VELAEASLPEGPWPYVKADAMLLERLLHNLIQNAIDFQDPYQPFRLQFEVRESGGTVCLHVIDGGRGIAPEASEKIFDLFYIGHEHATGAGLGLYEARVIAQKLQGSVRLLESRPGHTEFELCLQQG
jgi:signal transduction histidine kinase